MLRYELFHSAAENLLFVIDSHFNHSDCINANKPRIDLKNVPMKQLDFQWPRARTYVIRNERLKTLNPILEHGSIDVDATEQFNGGQIAKNAKGLTLRTTKVCNLKSNNETNRTSGSGNIQSEMSLIRATMNEE